MHCMNMYFSTFTKFTHSVCLLVLTVYVCNYLCSCACVCSSSGLVMLLQDPDPVVRVKAAEAMGHFH